MTREQALQQLKNPHLTTSEQEHLHQYLYYLDAEGIVNPKPSYPQELSQRRQHTRDQSAHRSGQREASKARKSSSQRKNSQPKESQ